MESCCKCGAPLERVLGVVKDGTVYEGYRCLGGHHRIVDLEQNHLPVQMEVVKGVPVAHVSCGQNCYIFDRGLFRSALRRVLVEGLGARPGALVLDLSTVSFAGPALMGGLRIVAQRLAERGRELQVAIASELVRKEAESAVPPLVGRFHASLERALEAARATAAAAG